MIGNRHRKRWSRINPTVEHGHHHFQQTVPTRLPTAWNRGLETLTHLPYQCLISGENMSSAVLVPHEVAQIWCFLLMDPYCLSRDCVPHRVDGPYSLQGTFDSGHPGMYAHRSQPLYILLMDKLTFPFCPLEETSSNPTGNTAYI